MCNSLTFLSHVDNIFFFFLLVFFGGFGQKNYANMCGHYGSKIMGVFSGPISETLGSTTNILWWYKPSLYGKLCPIYFSRELGSSGSIFVL
jgi:hypothetical protein